MAALFTKLCRREYRVITMRAFQLEFMTAFYAEVGLRLIIRLALRAFHIFCPDRKKSYEIVVPDPRP